jgi:hypothetical protein
VRAKDNFYQHDFITTSELLKNPALKQNDDKLFLWVHMSSKKQESILTTNGEPIITLKSNLRGTKPFKREKPLLLETLSRIFVVEWRGI